MTAPFLLPSPLGIPPKQVVNQDPFSANNVSAGVGSFIEGLHKMQKDKLDEALRQQATQVQQQQAATNEGYRRAQEARLAEQSRLQDQALREKAAHDAATQAQKAQEDQSIVNQLNATADADKTGKYPPKGQRPWDQLPTDGSAHDFLKTYSAFQLPQQPVVTQGDTGAVVTPRAIPGGPAAAPVRANPLLTHTTVPERTAAGGAGDARSALKALYALEDKDSTAADIGANLVAIGSPVGGSFAHQLATKAALANRGINPLGVKQETWDAANAYYDAVQSLRLAIIAAKGQRAAASPIMAQIEQALTNRPAHEGLQAKAARRAAVERLLEDMDKIAGPATEGNTPRQDSGSGYDH